MSLSLLFPNCKIRAWFVEWMVFSFVEKSCVRSNKLGERYVVKLHVRIICAEMVKANSNRKTLDLMWSPVLIFHSAFLMLQCFRAVSNLLSV